MKIRNQLLISSLGVIAFPILLGVLVIWQIRGVSESLSLQLSPEIPPFPDTLRMNALFHMIWSSEAAMALSTKNYALSGMPIWKERYGESEAQWKKTIQDLLGFCTAEEKDLTSHIQKISSEILAIHQRAFLLADASQRTKAVEWMEGKEYLNAKVLLTQDLSSLSSRRTHSLLRIAYGSSTALDSAKQQALSLQNIYSQYIEVMVMIMALALLGMNLMLYRSLVQPMEMIRQKIKALGLTDIDAGFTPSQGSEIHQLSSAFDRLAKDLQELRIIRDELNRFAEERLQVGKVLEEKEARYRQLYDDAPVGYHEINHQGRIISVNHTELSMLGYREDEMVGHPVWEYVQNSEASEKAVRDKLAGKISKVASFERFYIKKDGTPLPVLIDERIERNARGEVIRIRSTLQDITERRHSEEALQASEHKFKAIFESSSDAIFLLASDGFIDCNPRTLEIFGLPQRDDFFKLGPEDISPARQPDGRLSREAFQEHIQAAIQEGKHRFEWTYRRMNGEEFGAEIYLTTFEHDAEKVLQLTVHDITHRLMVEEAMKRAKEAAEAASRAKSDFLANMSHEIRTPMNAIIGLNHLIQQTGLTARQLEYAQKLEMAAKSLLGIINDILDFSKVEAGKLLLETVDFRLDDLLRSLGNILAANAQQKNIEILFSIAPDIPLELAGDPLRIQQILLNLGSNALKFTEQGEVVVSVQAKEIGESEALLEFSVRDTGIGIDGEQLAHIFDAFSQADTSTTRRFGGTGLGLAITKRLVHLMGGDIRVRSELGHGSDFIFTLLLPYARVSLEAAAVSQPEKRPLPENLRLLIIDDNPTAREILEVLASPLGSVTAVGSGEEAIQEVKQAVREERPFSVFIVDWKMPNMDGLETIRRIHQNHVSTKRSVYLLATAYPADVLSFTEKGVAPPIDGFLTKPFTRSTLVDTIAAALYSENPAGKMTLEKPADSALQLKGLRLLLVEDNPINREVADHILRNAGAIIDLAHNGWEAVEQVRLSECNYDAILMDLQMPVMDGYEATRRIRVLPGKENLKIIAMTADVLPSDRQNCIAVGMNDFIAKPIDISELFTVLKRWTCISTDTQAEGSIEKPQSESFPESWKDIRIAECMERLGGDEQLYRWLVSSFLEEHKSADELISQALAEKDAALAIRQAHTLKGLAASLGAATLSTAAAQLEDRLKKSQETEIPQAFQRFQAQLEMTVESLEELLTLYPGKEDPTRRSSQVVDPLVLQKVFDELERLLRKFDLAALDSFAELQELLPDEVAPSEIESIRKVLNSLEFEKGIRMIRELSSRVCKTEKEGLL